MTNMHEMKKMLTGHHVDAHNQDDKILKFLNLTQDDFNRYRDVWLDFDKEEIEVYTRGGGGNREYQEEVFTRMMEHPLYIRDEDNEIDCTYCSFYFHFPKTKEFLKFIKKFYPEYKEEIK